MLHQPAPMKLSAPSMPAMKGKPPWQLHPIIMKPQLLASQCLMKCLCMIMKSIQWGRVQLQYLEEALLAEHIQYCILLFSDLVSLSSQARRRFSGAHILNWDLR